MATGKAVIGRGTRVKGRVLGSDDLDIDGRVDGEVQIEGDVLVDSNGLVAANVSAHVITVRGAVKGDLSGSEAVRLEEGARVVGDLRAPKIAIAPGALVRGHVQTGAKAEAPARRSATAQAARPAAARPAAAAPARPATPARAPARAPAPPPRPVAKAPAATRAAMSAKAAPPPIVPALKKGAKGTMKKKA